MQYEVSSPPEKARTIGSPDPGESEGLGVFAVQLPAGSSSGSVMAASLLPQRFEMAQQALLVARVRGRDEDGVVAGHRAHDLGPGRAVDLDRDRLGRARGGREDREVRAGGAGAQQVPAARAEAQAPDAPRADSGARRDVASAQLADAEEAQVAADARLGRFDAAFGEERHQLLLPPHLSRAQDLEQRLAAVGMQVVEMVGEGAHGGSQKNAADIA